jgi:hypothetical protein
MPKTKDGWTLDDTPDFTPEQWAQIQQLIADGKQAEAQKMIDDILKAKEAQ